jgi:hypothetical protein
VFGMLEIVFSKYWITRRLGIARQLHVLLGDMRRVTANFNIGTCGLEAASQRVLALAVVVAIIVAVAAVIITVTTMAVATATATAATSAILLSLPHGLPFSMMFEFYSGC